MRNALALLLLLALPASADETKLDRKAETVWKPVIRAHTALAKWCKRKGFKREAYRQYAEVIAKKPDDFSARKALGYKKQKGEWILDHKKQMTKVDTLKGVTAKALQPELKKRLDALQAKEVAALRELAKEAAALELPARRKQYLSRIMTFLPDDAEARNELGWAKSGQNWLKSGMVARRTKAPQGTKIEGKHQVEDGLKITLHKRETEHFSIGTFESDEMAGKLLQAAELAHQTFHEWFACDPPMMSNFKMRLFFFPTKEKYAECIEKYSEASKKRKEHGKKSASTFVKGQGFVANRLKRTDPPFQYDRVVYLATRNMAWAFAGGKAGARPWLTEGLAWEMTLRTLGTRMHHSVALKEGTSTGAGKKSWSAHALWRSYLRELVLLREAPSLLLLLNTKSINEIANERAATSWSLTRYLLDRSPKKFAEFLRAVATSTPPAEALNDAFGVTPEQLEQDWKQYVLANY